MRSMSMRHLVILGVAICVGASASAQTNDATEARNLYLEVMKRSLLDLIYENDKKIRAGRLEGFDWPSRAMTMIGRKRLDNLQVLSEDVIARGVPGDLIETGAWRGGATIFMRAVLKAHGVTDRVVWVADSFEGLPTPDVEKYPKDGDSFFHDEVDLVVPLSEVKRNFSRYDLLDDQVSFLKGWFKDTLPVAPIEKLAILRLDGDLYESTMDALVNLYPKLSVGGYIIVDDYGALEMCKFAVRDYREKHGITEPIQSADWSAIYWKKLR